MIARRRLTSLVTASSTAAHLHHAVRIPPILLIEHLIVIECARWRGPAHKPQVYDAIRIHNVVEQILSLGDRVVQGLLLGLD